MGNCDKCQLHSVMQKTKYKDNSKSPWAFRFLKHLLSFKFFFLVIPIGYPRGITDGIFIINYFFNLKKKLKQVFFLLSFGKVLGSGLYWNWACFDSNPMQAFILVKANCRMFSPYTCDQLMLNLL